MVYNILFLYQKFFDMVYNILFLYQKFFELEAGFVIEMDVCNVDWRGTISVVIQQTKCGSQLGLIRISERDKVRQKTNNALDAMNAFLRVGFLNYCFGDFMN
eukprot:TRINITY_DN1622_c0_g1_i2.p3 TRINITY_DN1622_c0_g1~~TRINITY_DN1622_c0_g1_i2.p3  ORF type:complete len:102 (-),score=8.28 TRINITY_DN1622_c0_g1_i2:281-586(-)